MADPDFVGGSDTVTYRIPVTGSHPLEIAVEVLYQPIGHRWAMNLDGYDAMEPARFVEYWKGLSHLSSIVLARAVTVVPAPVE